MLLDDLLFGFIRSCYGSYAHGGLSLLLLVAIDAQAELARGLGHLLDGLLARVGL